MRIWWVDGLYWSHSFPSQHKSDSRVGALPYPQQSGTVLARAVSQEIYNVEIPQSSLGGLMAGKVSLEQSPSSKIDIVQSQTHKVLYNTVQYSTVQYSKVSTCWF